MKSPTGKMVSPNGTLYKVPGKHLSVLGLINKESRADLDGLVFSKAFSLLQKSRIIREDLYSAGRWAVEIHCEDRVN